MVSISGFATTLLPLVLGGWLIFMEGDWHKGQELILAGIIIAIAVLLLTYPHLSTFK